MYCEKKPKKQRKKSTVLSGLQSDQVLHLVLILSVVTNNFSISGVEIDDLKLFEVTCYPKINSFSAKSPTDKVQNVEKDL